MSGPLSDAEAARRMQELQKVISDESQCRCDEITKASYEGRDATKKKLLARFTQNVDAVHERRVNDAEIKTRTFKSNYILESRTECQNDRHAKTGEITNAVQERIQQQFKKDKAGYKKFLKDVILEGLIRLLEQAVYIRCRQEDISIIKDLIPEIKEEFANFMVNNMTVHKLTKEQAVVNLEVVENNTLKTHESTLGGVWLISHYGQIVLKNTVESRLKLVFDNSIPDIKQKLFPSMKLLEAKD